jgi:hypothetical protein
VKPIQTEKGQVMPGVFAPAPHQSGPNSLCHVAFGETGRQAMTVTVLVRQDQHNGYVTRTIESKSLTIASKHPASSQHYACWYNASHGGRFVASIRSAIRARAFQ